MAQKPSSKELEQRIRILKKRVIEAARDQKTYDDTRNTQKLLKLDPYGIFLIDLSGKFFLPRKWQQSV